VSEPEVDKTGQRRPGVDNGGPPLRAAVDETLGDVAVEVLIVTTVTWNPVEVEKRLLLLLDGCGDDDVVLDDDCSCLSDVMPLAASSSLTRAKYDVSG